MYSGCVCVCANVKYYPKMDFNRVDFGVNCSRYRFFYHFFTALINKHKRKWSWHLSELQCREDKRMAFPDQAKFCNWPIIERPVYSRHKCGHEGYISLTNRVVGPYYKLRPAISSFDLWPKRTLMSRNARRFCLIATSYIF